MLVSLCGIQSQVGCVLVDLDSGLVEPGLIRFGGRTFKNTVFTTPLTILYLHHSLFILFAAFHKKQIFLYYNNPERPISY